MAGFGPATASLGALSFRLHQELADKHDGYKNWGYTRSTATSLTEGLQSNGQSGGDWLAEGGSRAQGAGGQIGSDDTVDGPAWITRRSGDKSERISEVGGVAQVYASP